MNNTILKLTLSNIAKFKLHATQHGQNMKEHVHIEGNIKKHMKQLHYEKKQVLCMDLLPSSSMLASLVTSIV
jgi:hypothetical protein